MNAICRQRNIVLKLGISCRADTSLPATNFRVLDNCNSFLMCVCLEAYVTCSMLFLKSSLVLPKLSSLLEDHLSKFMDKLHAYHDFTVFKSYLL